MTTSSETKLAPPMTVEEFHVWKGDGTGKRYELVHGTLRELEPSSDTHGTIHASIANLISGHLRKALPGYRTVINPGIETRLSARWNYRVAELGVTATPNRADVHMMPAPIVLVEVLSATNAADTWSNIALFATVPSIAEILIVDSTKVAAEVLRRGDDGHWPSNPQAIGPGGTIRLGSIGLDVPLAEAYRRTHLAP